MSKQMLATLTAEHLAVLAMADNLRAKLAGAGASGELNGVKDQLREFAGVVNQAINQHFVQEEEELYPKLLKTNPGLDSTVSALRQDHEAIKQACCRLQAALRDDGPAAGNILDCGNALLDCIEAHFRREHDAFAAMVSKK